MVLQSLLIAAAFSVQWNGTELIQSDARISAVPFNRVWTGRQRTPDQTRMSKFVTFDMATGGELSVSFPDGLPRAEIFPLSLRPQLRREGNALRVRLDRPRHFLLDFGEAAEPLHAFANPPVAPRPGKGKVRYFGPGRHEAGVIVPESGETVYLAEGAEVHAAVFVDRAQDVRIVGRGIFDFSGFERCDRRISEVRKAHGLPETDTEFACGAFVVNASTNVLVEGIVMRDAPLWNCIVRGGSRNVTIDNIKIIGAWRYNADGIDIAGCEDVAVRNCFVRAFDDGAVVLDGYLDRRPVDSRNIVFEDNVFWNDWGASFKLWGGSFSCVNENVVFRRNCLARVCSRAFAVRSHLGCESWTARNILFEDIEIDWAGPQPITRHQKSDDETYQPGTVDEIGLYELALGWPVEDTGNQGRRKMSPDAAAKTRKTIEGVTFRNIRVVGEGVRLSAYRGTRGPNQAIRGIRFENCPAADEMIATAETLATFSGKNGALVSLKDADDAERVIPASEAFALSFLATNGEETVLSSSDFAFSRDGDVFRYVRPGGPTVEIAVRGEGGEILFRPKVTDWPEGLRLNWIDAPRVDVAEDGALYWPMLDGCEVTDYRTRLNRKSWSWYEPICFPKRCKGSSGLYPGVAQMQFLAHYRDGKGLYFAAHDAAHTQKGVEWERTEEGRVRLSLQTFCGEAKDGVWESPFDYRLRPYAGAWMEACSFYRDWVRTLPEFRNPPKRPAWMRDSPVVLIYPVKGEGKDNELDMGPNRYYPYVNAMAEVERYGKAFDSRIMALLMHWEGTAPWCPPYVWPPYGGEAELAKFRDALHARGDLLGLYCSGTAWTQVSCVDVRYSRSAQFVEEGLWRWMARGPKGEIDAAVCNHVKAQRFGYDLCLTEDWSRRTLIDEAVKMARFGTDYCQFFDQNLGGGPHLCWSAAHRHPSVPGAWETRAMADLQRDMIAACRAAGSEMAFGCEGAAATPFVGALPFNDARSFFPRKYGRSVPGMPFVFHEWMCNFSGNQCGSRSDPFFRMAYSFHCGDMMSVVLGADGKLVTSWTTPWSEKVPDQETMVGLVRTFNDLRRKYPQFLYDGRMAVPFAEIAAPEADDGGPDSVRRYPSVLSSFWEDGKGGRIGFLTNWRDVPVSAKICRDGVCETVEFKPFETKEMK